MELPADSVDGVSAVLSSGPPMSLKQRELWRVGQIWDSRANILRALDLARRCETTGKIKIPRRRQIFLLLVSEFKRFENLNRGSQIQPNKDGRWRNHRPS